MLPVPIDQTILAQRQSAAVERERGARPVRVRICNMSLRVTCAINTLIVLCLSCCSGGYFNLEVGDPCPTPNYRSSCQLPEQCTTVPQFIRTGHLRPENVLNCGYTVHGEKICCPIDTSGEQVLRISPGDDSATTKTTTKTTTTTRTTRTTTTTTTSKPTTITRSTKSPPWLGLFKTNREYLQRSVAQTTPYATGDSIVSSKTTGTKEDDCRTPLYEGTCQAVSKCESVGQLIAQQRLRDVDVESCRDGTFEEIICCPMSVPLQPRGQISTATRVGNEIEGAGDAAAAAAAATAANPASSSRSLASADELLPHYQHLAALAFPNAAFDGHVHRCTAVALTPKLLLTAAGCGRPSHAVFGVADMRDVDEEEDDLVEITHVSIYREDLAVLRMLRPRPQYEAPICSFYDQTRGQTRGQLVVSAWAKSKDGDCPLYELPMRLLPTAACQGIGGASKVPDLPARHLCLEPRQPTAIIPNADSCAPCPAVVGGVLHLLRPDGTRCVMAVATPTGANCSAQAMYFTTLLDRRLVEFVNLQL